MKICGEKKSGDYDSINTSIYISESCDPPETEGVKTELQKHAYIINTTNCVLRGRIVFRLA